RRLLVQQRQAAGLWVDGERADLAALLPAEVVDLAHGIKETLARMNGQEGWVDRFASEDWVRQPPARQVQLAAVDSLAAAAGVGADIDPLLVRFRRLIQRHGRGQEDPRADKPNGYCVTSPPHRTPSAHRPTFMPQTAYPSSTGLQAAAQTWMRHEGSRRQAGTGKVSAPLPLHIIAVLHVHRGLQPGVAQPGFIAGLIPAARAGRGKAWTFIWRGCRVGPALTGRVPAAAVRAATDNFFSFARPVGMETVNREIEESPGRPSARARSGVNVACCPSHSACALGDSLSS